MIAWDRVTRAHILRAIEDYDRLGPDRFFRRARLCADHDL